MSKLVKMTFILYTALISGSCQNNLIKNYPVSAGCVRACVYNSTTIGKDKYGRDTASVAGRKASLCALGCTDNTKAKP